MRIRIFTIGVIILLSTGMGSASADDAAQANNPAIIVH